MSIFNAWPLPQFTPRPLQKTALNWLESLPNDIKYIFLQAPVGGGKSLIGATYAKYLHAEDPQDAFLLTPQRVLQEQYENSFPRHLVATLYGRSNYTCSQKSTTCDVGSLVKPPCRNCPYTIAKNQAKSNPNVVLNYTLAFLAFKYTPIFDLPERYDIESKGRPLMVFDECHTIEHHLTELDALTISEGRCKQFEVDYKMIPNMSAAIDWIKKIYFPAAIEYVKELTIKLRDIIDGIEEPSKNHLQQLRRLNSAGDHIELISELISNPLNVLESKYVLLSEKSTMKFKRLTGAAAFKTFIEPMADRFLFMSSTILNYEGFCKDLGIDSEQAAYLELSSEFPVKNRPVFFTPQMKMNYEWKKPEKANQRQQMIDSILVLLEKHKNESGIIHTGSFAIAKWVVDEIQLAAPQKIFHHNPESGDDRNAIIKAFQEYSKPALLISPSITEGLDLKDDLGRFAIFVKTPFPNMADNWVKRRMELSQEWYQRQTLINIIQGSGRIVRSKDDWGATYILDGSFDFLYKRANKMIPKWWKDAYTVV